MTNWSKMNSGIYYTCLKCREPFQISRESGLETPILEFRDRYGKEYGGFLCEECEKKLFSFLRKKEDDK